MIPQVVIRTTLFCIVVYSCTNSSYIPFIWPSQAKREVQFMMPILQVRLREFNDLCIVTKQLHSRACLLSSSIFFFNMTCCFRALCSLLSPAGSPFLPFTSLSSSAANGLLWGGAASLLHPLVVIHHHPYWVLRMLLLCELTAHRLCNNSPMKWLKGKQAEALKGNLLGKKGRKEEGDGTVEGKKRECGNLGSQRGKICQGRGRREWLDLGGRWPN